MASTWSQCSSIELSGWCCSVSRIWSGLDQQNGRAAIEILLIDGDMSHFCWPCEYCQHVVVQLYKGKSYSDGLYWIKFVQFDTAIASQLNVMSPIEALSHIEGLALNHLEALF